MCDVYYSHFFKELKCPHGQWTMCSLCQGQTHFLNRDCITCKGLGVVPLDRNREPCNCVRIKKLEFLHSLYTSKLREISLTLGLLEEGERSVLPTK